MSISERDVSIILDWLTKQPHLPQNIHEMLVKRFLHASNNSIEKTKSLIDLFYTIRSQAPEIFDNRDPNQLELQEIFRYMDFVPLPKLTTKNQKLFIYRLVSNDADHFDYVNSLKGFFVFADVRMIEEQDFPEGEIPILDMKNITLKHLTKIVLPVMKKSMLYTQEAHPVKLREIHLINAPPFLDRCMAMVKPFLHSDVAKMIHFHAPNSTTLYNFISADLLPEDYGGKCEKISVLKKLWLEKVQKNRDYLLDDSRWKVDENKRLDKSTNTSTEQFNMEGSFRTLNID